jgi:mRNA interferase MazF
MEEQFDRWNDIKKRLAQPSDFPQTFPKQGEVWMCSLGWNLGREQNGGPHDFSRPALVIKKFNNEMFWIVPLSSKQKKLDFYFNYSDPHGQPVAAIIGQLRLVSTKRFQRNMYQLSPTDFAAVKARLRSFLF